jgi:hypothetical protein
VSEWSLEKNYERRDEFLLLSEEREDDERTDIIWGADIRRVDLALHTSTKFLALP